MYRLLDWLVLLCGVVALGIALAGSSPAVAWWLMGAAWLGVSVSVGLQAYASRKGGM